MDSGRPSVIVIGAGFGGLGVAHRLLRAGYDDVTVLERAADVGGVWRDNTYPNAACDVPSSLYSWSFAKKHDWTHRYARQPEILDYIRTTAAESGLRDRVRTGAQVTAAEWDQAARHWRVHLATGETLESDVLVPAVGQLSRPAIPRIPGLETFAGPQFHSATWDHDVDLRGRRVGVIGTGASAIQFVPGIVDEAGSVTVFQRSAPYVVPKTDRTYAEWEKRLFVRFPRIHDVARTGVFHLSEQLNKTLDADGRLAAALKRIWELHLRHQVRDQQLRTKLVPDYPLGCKRLLFSNDWYPALTRDDVDVVTDRITAVEPAGVRTADGILHELDVLILGTGFAATEFLGPIRVAGRDGLDLHEDAWHDGARAHLGITVPAFPNLFLVYGPNTNLGGSSIIGMLEAQAGYIAQAVLAVAGGGPLEVRQDAADAYDDEMQERLANSVWSGCASWYREPGGRVTTNWPGPVAEYQRRTARLEPADFAVATVGAGQSPGALRPS